MKRIFIAYGEPHSSPCPVFLHRVYLPYRLVRAPPKTLSEEASLQINPLSYFEPSFLPESSLPSFPSEPVCIPFARRIARPFRQSSARRLSSRVQEPDRVFPLLLINSWCFNIMDLRILRGRRAQKSSSAAFAFAFAVRQIFLNEAPFFHPRCFWNRASSAGWLEAIHE